MIVYWTTNALPNDDDWKFVKLSSLVPNWKLTMGPRYAIARWKDGEWRDPNGNEVTDVIGWSLLMEKDDDERG